MLQLSRKESEVSECAIENRSKSHVTREIIAQNDTSFLRALTIGMCNCLSIYEIVCLFVLFFCFFSSLGWLCCCCVSVDAQRNWIPRSFFCLSYFRRCLKKVGFFNLLMDLSREFYKLENTQSDIVRKNKIYIAHQILVKLISRTTNKILRLKIYYSFVILYIFYYTH